MLPTIKKIRFDGQHNSEIVLYLDNIRTNFASKELAWQTRSRVAKGLCWMSLKYLAQRCLRESQHPGACAGVVIVSDGNGLTKSVTQERWGNTRNKNWWLISQIRILDRFTPDTFEDISLQAELTQKENIDYKTPEIF